MSEHGHNHRHNAPLSDVALRVKALESLLTEKGLVDPAALDVIVEAYEKKIGPRNGAKVVAIHNLVVCTLCSCYPLPVLGLPPVWYKSAPYRARAVRDPRGVLKELGLDLPTEAEVRVWDSTAELRYLVLPERPAGSEGMDEAALAALVTRDAMIGVAQVTIPAGAKR